MRLLLSAACIDAVILAGVVDTLLDATFQIDYKIEYPITPILLWIFLLLIHWLVTETVLSGITVGRAILGLSMRDNMGRDLSKKRLALRFLGKVSTLGLSGLRLDKLAPYDNRNAIAWFSPLAESKRYGIPLIKLLVVNGLHSNASAALGDFQSFQHNRLIKIGRHPQNDLVLQDASVSRRHCELFVKGDSLYLKDCGSTTGTHLNGKKLKPGRDCHFGNADHFKVGGILIRLID
ncbi:MAG: FHA domain-containing protein [Pseudomonadota bacterium]